MIVVQGVPLNEAQIILVCILSVLSTDFKARRLESIPSFSIAVLTELFFFMQMSRKMSIHCKWSHILFQVRYGIYVILCIPCLYHAQLQTLSAELISLLCLKSYR